METTGVGILANIKVRVEVLYEVEGIEKQYDETRMVQVDPINNAITGI